MATWREARRGKYSVGFKKRVVAEALVPGASVASIARAHGLNGNMIFGWRKDPRFQPTEKKRKAMEAALAEAGSKATKPAVDEPAFLPIEVAVHSTPPPAEATVNRLVAKRFVKKQQMRWSRSGAHYLLKVRAAVLNGDLSDRTRYNPPQYSAKGDLAAFVSPKLPLFEYQQAA